MHRADTPGAPAAGTPPSPPSGTGEPAWYERYKPAAGRRAQFLAAALLWTVVGLALAAYGGGRTLRRSGDLRIWLFPCAVLLGVAKGRWVLARSAQRNLARIRERGDGRCLFGFLSLRGWAFVLCMMALGRALRHSTFTAPAVGPIYLAVGVALVAGSAEIWRARRQRLPRGEPGAS